MHIDLISTGWGIVLGLALYHGVLSVIRWWQDRQVSDNVMIVDGDLTVLLSRRAVGRLLLQQQATSSAGGKERMH